MNFEIRKIKCDEYGLLNDFLYEAIYIPEEVQAPPRSIIDLPELQVYVTDFGKEEDDTCFVAEVDGKVVGAVWVRVMEDYGHIEDGVPSFAISLYKEYRGIGIGTALMKKMLQELGQRGYKKTSLAVQKANYAVKMYKSVGFEIVDENEEEYIMVCRLNQCFSSEYCDVKYEERYNVVFVKWKKFCCKEDYRKPLEYALQIIARYNCNYVADTRNGFENIPEDTEWVASYFMPKAVEYGCQCIYFIIDEMNSLKEELKGQEADSNHIIEFKYIYDLDEIPAI